MISIDKIITPAPASGPPTPILRPVDGPTDGGSSARVKLPKLAMHSFDGDITKWPSFWDSYESAIHSNTSLSDVDKFNYLRSLLERTAKDAISGLSLTAGKPWRS